jgi:hypothetical protein
LEADDEIALRRGEEDACLADEIFESRASKRDGSLTWTRGCLPPETNWQEFEEVHVGDYIARYSYRRFDLDIVGPPVYPELPCDARTYYTASGMSSISAVILSLDRILDSEMEFWCPPDGYFETQHLVRAYSRKLVFRPLTSPFADGLSLRNPICLHFDSISAKNPFGSIHSPDIPWSNVLLAIVDTTCYVRTDPMISQIWSELAFHNVPVAFVRSHLKLDGFGSECARFGSVVLCEPDSGEGLSRDFSDSLRKMVPDAIRCFGLMANVDALPTFRQSEIYHRLTENRARRIQATCDRIVEVLMANLSVQGEYSVSAYHHKMFVTISHKAWSEKDLVTNAVREVLRQCEVSSLNVRRATSFGFRFAAICEVVDLGTGLWTLRISPSDESPDKGWAIAEIVHQVLTTGRDAVHTLGHSFAKPR